jgi:hypothetical protein
VQVATFDLSDGVTALSNSPPTVKPFEQQELRGTVTVRPDFKIPNQKVTQK